ncbi:MAG: serine hydrolase [Flavobacteriaceae bacterium]|nr:serine hydrolase [Flavobacteriaceae bacterium]
MLMLVFALDLQYLLKGIRVVYLTGHQSAFIEDYPYFDNRLIAKAKSSKLIPKHKDYHQKSLKAGASAFFESYETTAFLVIKNDSLWYEYYDLYTDSTTISNSFSMAKSITVSLLFKAIQDGYIKGLDQPITDFFPEFAGDYAERCTMRDLASMASGLSWEEHYKNPFSITAKSYYTSDIEQLITGLSIDEVPGKEFNYLSGNTQLLGLALQKAVGTSLSAYLSESFWEPMGMEQKALWQLDSEASGNEKSYCCIAATARDFARFGLLYKNFGNYYGQQLIDTSFVELATQPRFKAAPQYGYGFWLGKHRDHDFYLMQGIQGQYVIVIPGLNVVIVRLGHKNNPKRIRTLHQDLYDYIDLVLP